MDMTTTGRGNARSAFPLPLYGAEFEHELQRDPALGFDAEPSGPVGCLAHGAPSRLERWHYHEDYELHLVVGTRGKAYIGDDIADFAPGFVVLIGPHVPHNLVSIDVPAGGVAARSIAIHFREEALRKAFELFPDLGSAVSLLERARHGIEFHGTDADIRARFNRIRHCTGLSRFAELAALLGLLAQWPAHRPLSGIRSQAGQGGGGRDNPARNVEKALGYICSNYAENLSLASVSAAVGMGEQALSRYFRRVTGGTFVACVARVRVAKACHLLRQGTQQVASICYLVGFNNISNFNRQFRKLKGMTPGEYRAHRGFRRELTPPE